MRLSLGISQKSGLPKERTLLIGKNLVDSKVEIFEEIKEMKRKLASQERTIIEMKKIIENLIQQTGKYVKRNEVMLIERI